MNTGHMNFFKINECGLYKVGKKQAHGCEIEESLDLIFDWVKDKSLAQTIPWDETRKNANRTKCYCQDFYKDPETGDYLLVLWKSDTDSAGTLWGAPESNTAGKGKVVKYTNQYNGEKVIWGRPCYYWIVPKHNSIISIKFDSSVCDAAMFQDWITSAVTNRAKHPNRVKTITEHGFVRLSHSDSTETNPYKFFYKFDISLRSLATSSVALEELSRKITHVIKRETITVNTRDERDDWVKIFDSIPYLAAKPKAKKRRIEIKAEAKPTSAELKKIIENYSNDGRKPSDWDNVGFEKDDKSITWVDKYRLKEYITVPSDAPDILPAAYLFNEIRKNRSRYLTPLLKSDKFEQESEARSVS